MPRPPSGRPPACAHHSRQHVLNYLYVDDGGTPIHNAHEHKMVPALCKIFDLRSKPIFHDVNINILGVAEHVGAVRPPKT